MDYLDFEQKRIGLSDPDYRMDDPHDYPPTIYRDIYPVRLMVGEGVLDAVHRALDPNNTAFMGEQHEPDWDRKKTVMDEVDEVLADPDSTLADFVRVAGAELVYPKRLFPHYYTTTINAGVIEAVTGKE